MFEDKDCNPEFMNSVDEWLSDEENALLMHNTKNGLDAIPYLLAVDLCRQYLDASGYYVQGKGIPTMEERRLTSREKTLENRVADLENFLAEKYYDNEDSGIKVLLLAGENFTKCARCECLIHNEEGFTKNEQKYCDNCRGEV